MSLETGESTRPISNKDGIDNDYIVLNNSESSQSEGNHKDQEDSDQDEKSEKECDYAKSEGSRKLIQEPTAPNSSYRRRSQNSNTYNPRMEFNAVDSCQKHHTLPSNRSSSSTSSQVKNLRDLAMKSKPLPTNNVSILNELIETLYDERMQEAQKGNFEKSVSIMRAIDYTKEYLRIAEKKEFQQKQMNEVSKENNKVQSRIAKFDEETKNLEKALKKNLAKSREALINELKLEAQNQNIYWESESHMRLYNRPSNQLRALRHQANQMVACGRFRDAEEVLKEANRLQSQEQRKEAYQMQKDYENATKLFDQKVKEELDTFDLDAKNQIESLRARRATMRTVFKNQERKVEQRSELVSDMEKCWNANMRIIVKEKIYKSSNRPEEMIPTTRSLGKKLTEKPENIILSLPKLHTKKVMEKPIPTPDYL